MGAPVEEFTCHTCGQRREGEAPHDVATRFLGQKVCEECGRRAESDLEWWDSVRRGARE